MMEELAGRTQRQLAQFLSRHCVIPSLLFFCGWMSDVIAALWMWHIHTRVHSHTHTHTHTLSLGPVTAGKPTLTAGVAIAAVAMSCTPKFSLQGVTPYFCFMSACRRTLLNDEKFSNVFAFLELMCRVCLVFNLYNFYFFKNPIHKLWFGLGLWVNLFDCLLREILSHWSISRDISFPFLLRKLWFENNSVLEHWYAFEVSGKFGATVTHFTPFTVTWVTLHVLMR